MAHQQAQPRNSPPKMGIPHHGGPQGGQKIPPNQLMGPQPMGDQPPPQVQVEAPPENTYPCGCAWPGTHKQDCMWSLWEQMRDNYLKTRELMGKFMTQANTMQEAAREGVKCECPPDCHGTDLGAAMGLQQMTGVTVPWNTVLGDAAAGLGATGVAAGAGGRPPPQTYSVENEARKLMEEQRRIKNTWIQFLNIFDMALDMANDVSKDRWEQNRRRKERQKLEREQRLEEMRKERLERQKGSKPEPPPEKDKTTEKDEKKNKPEQPKEEKPKTPAETPTEDDKPKEEPAVEQDEGTPAEEAAPAEEAETEDA